MGRVRVEMTAAATDTRLVSKAPARRHRSVEPTARMYIELIEHAVKDAKRMRDGLPTYGALLARWWIEEHKPAATDRVDWERSFACACEWLSLDLAVERARLVAAIEQSWAEQCVRWMRDGAYVRRAVVLTCAGIPTAIARQMMMPLVSQAEWEDVAGVDHEDPKAVTRMLELQAA